MRFFLNNNCTAIFSNFGYSVGEKNENTIEMNALFQTRCLFGYIVDLWTCVLVEACICLCSVDGVNCLARFKCMVRNFQSPFFQVLVRKDNWVDINACTLLFSLFFYTYLFASIEAAILSTYLNTYNKETKENEVKKLSTKNHHHHPDEKKIGITKRIFQVDNS